MKIHWDWWKIFATSVFSVFSENLARVFLGREVLTVFSDVGIPEIVESTYSVEIVEFAEFTEIVENCGILLKLAI